MYKTGNIVERMDYFFISYFAFMSWFILKGLLHYKTISWCTIAVNVWWMNFFILRKNVSFYKDI